MCTDSTEYSVLKSAHMTYFPLLQTSPSSCPIVKFGTSFDHLIAMKTIEPPLERSALVAYGSETGNAQDLADELARLTQRLRFMTQVSHLDALEPVRAMPSETSVRKQC